LTPKSKYHESGPIRIATSDEDQPELERLKNGIIKLLKKFGGYEPALDDILIEQIASSTIYWKKVERFLDTASATEYTYASIADSKVKWQKMIDTAMRELALSRRDRLNQQSQTDFTRQLQEAIAKAKKAKKHWPI
jgi:translation initiation factor 2B subunit (eIF-2B alpha/beta/delta family)